MTGGDWDAFSVQLKSGEAESRLHSLMVERQLLVKDANDDRSALDAARQQFVRKIAYPFILYLLAARGCNFACKYCPVPKYQKTLGDSFIRADAVAAAMDAWLELIEEQYDSDQTHLVIIYGGEPLLNAETLPQVVRHIQNIESGKRFLPRKIKIVLATNGYFITRAIAQFCKDHEIDVQVGVDGISDNENRNRSTKEGNSTIQAVLSGISVLREAGVNIHASVAVTPQNLKFISNATNLLADLGIKRLGLNMLRGDSLSDLVASSERATFLSGAARAIIENYENSYSKESEAYFMRKWRALNEQQYFPVDCTCYGNQLVMHSDGRVGHCPFDPNESSSAADVGSFADAVRREHHTIVDYLFSDDMVKCDWISAYGGGCGWGRKDATNSGEADAMSVSVTETLFDYILWKMN